MPDTSRITGRVVRPESLNVYELCLQTAAHEAGHGVVGVSLGFELLHIQMGATGEEMSGGFVIGGCAFVAPEGDMNQLARQRPHEYAVMSLSGVLAEQLLTGRYLDQGWFADVEILRRGLGLTDGLSRDDFNEHIRPLIAEAEAEVLRWQPTIRRVASALAGCELLEGAFVEEQVRAVRELKLPR